MSTSVLILGTILLIIGLTAIIIQFRWLQKWHICKEKAKHCPQCNYKFNDKTYRFCPKCGEELITQSRINETNHILSNPTNRKRIHESLTQYNQLEEIRKGWAEQANKIATIKDDDLNAWPK